VSRSAAPRSTRRLAFAVAAIVVALDTITKALAAHYLAHRGIVNVLGGAFHLELYRNHAGPGNSFEGHPVFVSLLSLAAVTAIAVVATMVRGTTTAITCGLLLGGGLGNVIDRLVTAPGPLRGGVIDWLKPTLSSGSMNLADLSINLALVVLVVGSLIELGLAQRSRPPAPSEVAP
jgi:signal peptidase II